MTSYILAAPHTARHNILRDVPITTSESNKKVRLHYRYTAPLKRRRPLQALTVSTDPSDCTYRVRSFPFTSPTSFRAAYITPLAVFIDLHRKLFRIASSSLSSSFPFFVPPFSTHMKPLPKIICAGDGAVASENLSVDASHNPSPVSTPHSGPLCQSSLIPGHLRIPSIPCNPMECFE